VHTSTTARLALLALIWGSSFLWIKLSLRGLSPVEVTFGRLILGAAVLFVIAGVQRSPLPRSPALWGHMTVADERTVTLARVTGLVVALRRGPGPDRATLAGPGLAGARWVAMDAPEIQTREGDGE
jgi:drug/metabolite transporter (DMT)-like permease